MNPGTHWRQMDHTERFLMESARIRAAASIQHRSCAFRRARHASRTDRPRRLHRGDSERGPDGHRRRYLLSLRLLVEPGEDRRTCRNDRPGSAMSSEGIGVEARIGGCVSLALEAELGALLLALAYFLIGLWRKTFPPFVPQSCAEGGSRPGIARLRRRESSA